MRSLNPLDAFRDNLHAARQYAAHKAARTKMIDLELVCDDCRAIFKWRSSEASLKHRNSTKRYCPKCSTPTAKRRRMLARKEAQ